MAFGSAAHNVRHFVPCEWSLYWYDAIANYDDEFFRMHRLVLINFVYNWTGGTFEVAEIGENGDILVAPLGDFPGDAVSYWFGIVELKRNDFNPPSFNVVIDDESMYNHCRICENICECPPFISHINITTNRLIIYNSSDVTVSLRGYSLTDSADNANSWQLPALILRAGEFVSVRGYSNTSTTVHKSMTASFDFTGNVILSKSPSGYSSEFVFPNLDAVLNMTDAQLVAQSRLTRSREDVEFTSAVLDFYVIESSNTAQLRMFSGTPSSSAQEAVEQVRERFDRGTSSNVSVAAELITEHEYVYEVLVLFSQNGVQSGRNRVFVYKDSVITQTPSETNPNVRWNFITEQYRNIEAVREILDSRTSLSGGRLLYRTVNECEDYFTHTIYYAEIDSRVDPVICVCCGTANVYDHSVAVLRQRVTTVRKTDGFIQTVIVRDALRGVEIR
jgi:hypothetical protein